MAKLTIGRMANLYGLHRSTLHEAVKKGRVSAGLDGKGQKVIDLSEMIRVYGEPPNTALHLPTPKPNTSPTLSSEAFSSLLEELRLLRKEVRELRQSMRLLEHKPEPVLETDAEPKPQQTVNSSPSLKATWASLFDALDND